MLSSVSAVATPLDTLLPLMTTEHQSIGAPDTLADARDNTYAPMLFDEHTDEQSAEDDVLAPYGASHEHLADLLVRHNWLLKRQIARSKVRTPADILGI